MPSRFAELQLTREIVEVLNHAGITDLESLARGDVPEIQREFIRAAHEGRYPEKFPSLVKVASWVEQAKDLLPKALGGTAPTDLDAIPTAVVKPAKPRKVYQGAGPHSHTRQIEFKPDRHRPRKNPEAETLPSGERIVPTPREEQPLARDFLEELNPERQRTLYQRRPSPRLHKASADSVPDESAPSGTSASAPASADAPATSETTSDRQPQPPPTPTTTTDSESETEPAPAGAAAAFRSFEDYKQGRTRVKPLDRHSLKTGEDRTRSTGSEQESFEEEQVYKKKCPSGACAE